MLTELKTYLYPFVIASTILITTGCNSDSIEQLPVEQIVHENGSGFTDLTGHTINYEYVGFGAFRINFFDNQVQWEGYKNGYFKGASQVLTPQVSKVAEGVYFASWPISPISGDNVVYNFNGMTVRAHLGGGADRFIPIYGQIHCIDGDECLAPSDPGNGMDLPEVVGLIGENTAIQGLSPLVPPAIGNQSLAEEAAMIQLDGRALVYNTPEGSVRVRIEDLQLMESVDGGVSETEHISHVSLIGKNIYLMSWGDDVNGPGNHIVFNRDTMKVFDHIMPDQTRAEAIYDAICFDVAEKCSGD